MPFRKKGSPNWHYDIRVNGRRYCGSAGTENFEEAKAVEAEVRRAAKVRRDDKGSYTVAEALGTYWSEVSSRQTCSKTTLSQSSMLISVLDPRRPIHKLTQADLTTFAIRRRATASNATVNRQLQLLGRAVRHMGKVHGAKMPDIDFKAAETKEPKERVRELTMDEQSRLFDHLRPDTVPFVKFALMTGARKATIENLKWTDVDLEGGRMVFRMKGGDKMSYPISNQLRAILTSLPRSNVLSYRQHVFTLVHQITAERQPVRPNTFDGIWRKALKDADIEDFRFHDLRHTFATRMLRRTGNLKLVSKLLGHSDVSTTARYAHVLDEDMRFALDGFDPLETVESRKNSRKSQ